MSYATKARQHRDPWVRAAGSRRSVHDRATSSSRRDRAAAHSSL